MNKEKIEDFLLYSLVIIMIAVTFQMSYNYGIDTRDQKEIVPVGQEYHIKDVYISNSTYLIKYHDNDANMTEKTMLPTNYVNISFIASNSSIMRLEKVENGIQYWNVSRYYKNMTEMPTTKTG